MRITVVGAREGDASRVVGIIYGDWLTGLALDQNRGSDVNAAGKD